MGFLDRFRQAPPSSFGKEKPSDIVVPGYVDGDHFTKYVDEVKSLRKEGKIDEAEALLLRLDKMPQRRKVQYRNGVLHLGIMNSLQSSIESRKSM
jgi:hypothetical protein